MMRIAFPIFFILFFAGCTSLEGGPQTKGATEAKTGVQVIQASAQAMEELDKAEASGRTNSRARWIASSKSASTATSEMLNQLLKKEAIDRGQAAAMAASDSGTYLVLDGLYRQCRAGNDLACNRHAALLKVIRGEQ